MLPWEWPSCAPVCQLGRTNPRSKLETDANDESSGGLYYAAAVLAPPGWGPFAAWITGWSNWLTQVTAAPSVDYALSAMILAAASISNPEYVPTNYQTFLLTALVMLIHACISSMPTLWIANFNSWGSTLNMICLVVVVIMIPASVTGTDTTPKFQPSSQVWAIQNGTDWPDGIAVLMSFLAIIWTMSGYGMPSPQFEFDRRVLMVLQMLPSISQRNVATPMLHLRVQ